MKKNRYDVRLRNVKTGAEHSRLSIAADELAARENAVERAKAAETNMADREYGQFEVVSCVPAAS